MILKCDFVTELFANDCYTKVVNKKHQITKKKRKNQMQEDDAKTKMNQRRTIYVSIKY